MAKKHSRLRLVSSQDDPANIFDDLDALRRAQAAPATPAEPAFPKQRRQRSTETFARIPHNRARALYRHIGGPAWILLIELDWLILKGGGRNPVRLTSAVRETLGLTKWAQYRGLKQLEAAGVITVERRSGRCLLVTFCWYPRHPH